MASSDSEDDFVEYGTPLEPLEEDEVPRKKPLTLEEQVVTDKQGRRRFHGAFTGGFSAGFFNTVGSLEGWKPSSFKSSRSEKGSLAQQKPEDFMDDEDMDEFGIAPNILHARDDYSTSSKKRKQVEFHDGPIPGKPVLNDLLQPIRETVGIKLLKSMGWKPGQGIGPRLSKAEKQRSAKTIKKMYGCMLPPGVDEQQNDSDSDSDSELDWENVTFAPDDYQPFLCKPKENCFGMGYVGLEKRSVLGNSHRSELRLQEKKQKVHIKGQAFGVGAFEEEDEDIYSREDMSRYDFTLEDDTESQKSKKPEKFREGVLEGFAPAVKKIIKKFFPPPVIPKDFKAVHKIRVSRFEPIAAPEKRRDLNRHEMRSSDRGALIGESSKEAVVDEKQKEARKLTEESISSVTVNTGGFRPFVLNPDKQVRYEKYLKLVQIGKQDCLNDLQPITMSDWDREREKVEFEQAARLFKPLTGVIKDRFTTASQPDDLRDPLAVVEKIKHGTDDQRKAAEMKMFGKLTREIKEWKPCSLLCKRFNVPEPNTSASVQPSKKKSNFSIFDCLETHSAEIPSTSESKLHEIIPASATEKTSAEEEKPEEEDTAGEKEVVESANTTFTDQKEKIDLFKAIFLDSDDEEDQSEANEDKEVESNMETRLFDDEKITNDKRNTSPARGIFENVDFDSLLPRGEKSKMTVGKTADVHNEPVSVGQIADEKSEDLAYGPKLPEKLTAKNYSASSVDVPVEGDLWTEKRIREKKHKKKDKKHKKDKHKSKHKHKKHKR